MLQNIIYIILTTSFVHIVAMICKFINSKIDQIQLDKAISQDIIFSNYVDTAQQVVEDAVLTISQTYVDSLKKSGNFSKTAQIEAKEKALEIINTLITTNVRNAIQAVYGDFDYWADNMIETYVKKVGASK